MANKKAEILTMNGQVVSPITLATNVLLEDGRTAQDLLDSRDESMFSPTITTSSSISKVGQGDNVDFSDNVIDGAYESCVLKGKTLVNYNTEGNDRNEYVCMPSVEGSSLTVNDTVEGKVKSAILKGQTLVNLCVGHLSLSNTDSVFTTYSDGTYTYSAQEGYDGSIAPANMLEIKTPYKLKPNNTYTIIVTQLTGGESKFGVRYWDGNNNYDSAEDVAKTGVHKHSFRTSDNDGDSYLALRLGHYTSERSISFKDIILLEGDYTNVDIPYFEGMQSVKVPVLTTTGKNLWDDNWSKGLTQTSGNVLTGATYDGFRYNNNLIPVGGISTIYLKHFCPQEGVPQSFRVGQYGKDKEWLNKPLTIVTDGIFNIPSDCKYIRVHVDLRYNGTSNNTSDSIPTMMVVSTSKITDYEPYKTNILTTAGKNLFNMNRRCDNLTDSQATVVQDTNQITVSSSAESGIYVNANFILDKDFFAGKTVTGSCLYESDEKDIGTVQITYQDGNGEHHYQWIRTPKTFTFPNSFIGDVMLSVSANNTGTPQSNTVTVKNIQLELGSTATSYEPYSEVVLRGIGEVKDTLDCLTGEMTQRIGEVVLDGSEYWGRYLEYTDSISFISAQISDSIDKQHNANDLIVDKLIASGYGAWSKDYNITLNTKRFSVCVPKTVANDVATFKKWLSENNVTVQYPLATPTVKTVDLSDNVVYSYKDTTHYTCSSEEGSLLPTLTIEEGVKYKAIIKPSTKYSIVFNRIEVASGLTVDLGGATASVTSTTLGKTIVQITTLPTLSHNYVIFKGIGNTIKDVQVIEGEVVGDEPYFEGMVDVKNPSVMNCNTVDTEDENYKSNTISTNEVVLRSLPNGVCDTLDLETGEYVQRIGEIVLDGSESWQTSWDGLLFFMHSDSKPYSKLIAKNYTATDERKNTDCIFKGNAGLAIVKNGINTVVALKQWLSQNPITVQYELATPITTTIDLKQHPYAYKDGYVVLTSSSEDISLTPTIEYSLIANRLGQIQSNQKLVEKQQSQIDELESMVVANLVNTQYQQALNEIKLGVK